VENTGASESQEGIRAASFNTSLIFKNAILRFSFAVSDILDATATTHSS
jgi:hypothetical protein